MAVAAALVVLVAFPLVPLSSRRDRAAIMSATELPELSLDEIRRYSRHLILSDLGIEGQRKLKAGSVLCIGSGGLGSPAIMYLAAAGVGTIGIVDDDVVDESNLQRQIVHSTDMIGEPKVESARERVRQINPHVKVVTYRERVSGANALKMLAPYDLVVDGSDNFPTRYLVNDACIILKKPLVYGAVQRFEGQVSLFNYRGGPNYRDLFPTPPPPGGVPSCAEGGVLGVLPGVIGTLQATEAIKVFLDRDEAECLSGRLLLYDAMRMSFREVRLVSRPHVQPVTQLIDYLGFCGQPAADGATEDLTSAVEEEPYVRVGVAEVCARLANSWEPFVLDVRTAQEAAIVSLPFVDLQQPHRQVAHVAAALPRDRDILVHCKAGLRSRIACETLAKLGFLPERLFSMEGGILAWATQLDPSMPLY